MDELEKEYYNELGPYLKNIITCPEADRQLTALNLILENRELTITEQANLSEWKSEDLPLFRAVNRLRDVVHSTGWSTVSAQIKQDIKQSIKNLNDAGTIAEEIKPISDTASILNLMQIMPLYLIEQSIQSIQYIFPMEDKEISKTIEGSIDKTIEKTSNKILKNIEIIVTNSLQNGEFISSASKVVVSDVVEGALEDFAITTSASIGSNIAKNFTSFYKDEKESKNTQETPDKDKKELKIIEETIETATKNSITDMLYSSLYNASDPKKIGLVGLVSLTISSSLYNFLRSNVDVDKAKLVTSIASSAALEIVDCVYRSKSLKESVIKGLYKLVTKSAYSLTWYNIGGKEKLKKEKNLKKKLLKSLPMVSSSLFVSKLVDSVIENIQNYFSSQAKAQQNSKESEYPKQNFTDSSSALFPVNQKIENSIIFNNTDYQKLYFPEQNLVTNNMINAPADKLTSDFIINNTSSILLTSIFVISSVIKPIFGSGTKKTRTPVKNVSKYDSKTEIKQPQSIKLSTSAKSVTPKL
jgi:hypothetical protein